MKITDFLKTQINKGTEHYAEDNHSKGRVRQVNSVTLFVFVAQALILIFALLTKDYLEFFTVLVTVFLNYIALACNRKGHYNVSVFILVIVGFLFTTFLVLTSKVQMAAHYFNFVVAISIVHLTDRKIFRRIVVAIALVLFAFLQYYQQKFLPFDELEFYTTGLMMLMIIIVIFVNESEVFKYQNLIKDQNKDLIEKNERIKEQGEELLESERKRREQELLSKQKDLDSVLAHNQLQIEIRKNLIAELDLLKEKVSGADIKKLILSLKSQNESQDRINLVHNNVDKVNSEFFTRITEQYPALNKNELELCSYMRLGLTSKEIATLKNSRENTVNVSKSRLRDKLGFPSNAELQNFLLQV